METAIEYIRAIFTPSFHKMIVSKQREKTSNLKKVEIAPMRGAYQVTRFEGVQVFHKTYDLSDVIDYCTSLLNVVFLQVNAWDDSYEYCVMISKKGQISFSKHANKGSVIANSTSHDRVKRYIIEEGVPVEPLIDMGIFTANGQVVKSKYDKFKQINRFLELIDDVAKDSKQSLNIIDFGCGKSYLTFVLYYYFTYIRKISVNVIGLDLKSDVIKKCNEIARKYGYNKLHFELGDINGYQPNNKIDMVISLHACDTATDYALFNAIQWNVKYIFSVPCCQHELNKQMNPQTYSIFSRYGIIQERTAALMTDAIRANLLDCCGYKTQLLEFVDLEHTPKNLLIRAVYTGRNKKTSSQPLTEALSLMEEFCFQPTLYNLLHFSDPSLI